MLLLLEAPAVPGGSGERIGDRFYLSAVRDFTIRAAGRRIDFLRNRQEGRGSPRAGEESLAQVIVRRNEQCRTSQGRAEAPHA
jgi:hypothetical protein